MIFNVPANKELKLTKPSIMEPRSLSPVFCGPLDEHGGMSYCGVAYRLSFKRLAAIRGSRAQQLLDRLTPELAVDDADCDEDDDGDESLPRPSEALGQIVMGEPLVADAPELYGPGLSAVYGHIGHVLSNSAFAPAGWEFIKEVDAALAAEGMPEPLRAVTLFSRGFPLLEISVPEPFPLFGYLTPDEVASGRGRVQGVRWFRYDTYLHPAIKQFHLWLDEAAGEGQGLVGSYG
jgi:hypothetical protein